MKEKLQKEMFIWITFVIVVAIQVAMHFWALTHLNIEELIALGPNYFPKTTDGEWWRLLTSLGVSLNSGVLAANVLGAGVSVYVLRKRLAYWEWLALYLSFGIAGESLVLFVPKIMMSMGPTAATSGMLVFCLPFLWMDEEPLPIKASIATFIAAFFYLAMVYVPMGPISCLASLGLTVLLILISYLIEGVDSIKAAGCLLATAMLSFQFVPTSFDYTILYEEFSRDWTACREQMESLKGRKKLSVDKELAYYDAIIDVSCQPALAKASKIDQLMWVIHGKKKWNRIKNSIQDDILVVEISQEHMRYLQVKMQVGIFTKKKNWVQMVQLLEKSLKERPVVLNELEEKARHIVSAQILKKKKKLQDQLTRLQVAYQNLGKKFEKLKLMFPEQKMLAEVKALEEQKVKDLRTTSLISRYEDGEKKCGNMIEELTLEKDKYYFPDYEKHLMNMLRETCRPALFLNERLQGRLQGKEQRYWATRKLTVRNMIWVVQSVLEIVRYREFRVQLSQAKYQEDTGKVKEYKSQLMPRRMSKIDILLEEFQETYQKRESLRDGKLVKKLKDALLGYNKIQDPNYGRKPAAVKKPTPTPYEIPL